MIWLSEDAKEGINVKEAYISVCQESDQNIRGPFSKKQSRYCCRSNGSSIYALNENVLLLILRGRDDHQGNCE